MQSIQQNGKQQQNSVRNTECISESYPKNKCLSKSDQFIAKANNIHNNKYDYNKTEYIKSSSKVIITCPIHGDFFQTPNKHISACCGCPECAREKQNQQKSQQKKSNIRRLFEHFKHIEPNHHYEIIDDSISVLCEQHGETIHKYRPNNYNKYPCKQCGIISRTHQLFKPSNSYINQARSLHNGLYDYQTINQQLFAVCKVHGLFELSGNRKANHINRLSGCPECAKQLKSSKLSKSKDDFVEQANHVHNYTYSYHTMYYKNTHTMVTITCPTHGDFMQTPLNHLQGAGCPACFSSNKERKLYYALQQQDIHFKHQITFDWAKNPKTNRNLYYDFLLVHLNILLEVDGPQHYKPIQFCNQLDSVHELQELQYRDQLKNQLAIDHEFEILRIPDTDVDYLIEQLPHLT